MLNLESKPVCAVNVNISLTIIRNMLRQINRYRLMHWNYRDATRTGIFIEVDKNINNALSFLSIVYAILVLKLSMHSSDVNPF